jgi:sodium/bile acid cotransporter 7
MVMADIVLLAIIMAFGWFAGKSMGLPREDRMVMLFCGSTKSLASGIPIANILFVGQPIGLIVLPLMLFHQLQLFVCAIIAQRQAYRLSQTLQVA